MSNATIVYTSDHGQDLHERGNPGKNTHCGGENANIEEGLVPLVVITDGHQSEQDWQKNLQNNFQSSSHYMIFPTLLVLMGYQKNDVRKIYGATLLDQANDPYTFNILFNARLGKKPKWRKINLDDISRPDPSEGLADGLISH